MNTIADKLIYLNETKKAIKAAMIAKGVVVPNGTPFSQYAELIRTQLCGGG